MSTVFETFWILRAGRPRETFLRLLGDCGPETPSCSDPSDSPNLCTKGRGGVRAADPSEYPRGHEKRASPGSHFLGLVDEAGSQVTSTPAASGPEKQLGNTLVTPALSVPWWLQQQNCAVAATCGHGRCELHAILRLTPKSLAASDVLRPAKRKILRFLQRKGCEPTCSHHGHCDSATMRFLCRQAPTAVHA